MDINSKLKEKANKLNKSMKSVRIKLFLTISITVSIVIAMLVLINGVVLEKLYLYNRTKLVRELCEQVNSYYNNNLQHEEIERNLKILSINHNLDILVVNDIHSIFITDGQTNEVQSNNFFQDINSNSENISDVYSDKQCEIKSLKEKSTSITYLVANFKMQNGSTLYIRNPITGIKESARISNNLLITIGLFSIIISGIVSSFVSRRFTKPIVELNDIAKKMSNLDFSSKYIIDEENEDEINTLGKSINTMSDKLESTINKLEKSNSELEKDIENKSKIDEMRKQFISDVSHELKTPIALIQGYAEGLVENVNTDDESRKFYAEVILDEANKMDLLVKQLLELMKLEYGKREFNNHLFDIVSLIKEVIRKSKVMLDENNIVIKFDINKEIIVFADSFYIEQVITNYLTNAIKYSKEVNNERKIIINVAENNVSSKVRISVFNTGDRISQSELQRIWGRFYKIDTSRNRKNGGTGIGLAFVKAVMNNYKNEYGAINKENGIEFYFDLDKIKTNKREK